MTVDSDISAAAYAALFAVMALSWAGLPTAGQAALVTAGVYAGHGQLDIVAVLGSAAVGSALGGCAGYWLGRRGGRALWTMRGPLRQRRRKELERGGRLIERHGPLAVLLVPMWIPGVYEMEWRRFLRWNLVAALAWTLVAGLGGYFVGPAMTHALGVATTAILAAIVVAVALTIARVVIVRRRG